MPRPTLGRRLFYDVLRQIARVFFAAFFCLRCQGRKHWPDEGAAVVCSNHQSFLDPVLVGLTCDRRLNFLARKTLFSFGPFGWLIEALDAIPIEREGLGIGGLKETLRRLRRGEMVLMFPEGTRTRTGELSPLKPGFCALVRHTKVQIVPLAVEGAFQAWPKGQPLPKLATVHICVGQPITPEQIREWSDEELVAAVSERVEHCLADARASRQTARDGGWKRHFRRRSLVSHV